AVFLFARQPQANSPKQKTKPLPYIYVIFPGSERPFFCQHTQFPLSAAVFPPNPGGKSSRPPIGAGGEAFPHSWKLRDRDRADSLQKKAAPAQMPFNALHGKTSAVHSPGIPKSQIFKEKIKKTSASKSKRSSELRER
ncbi:hypothetical protein ACFPVY_15680, partial [Flavobacterium qiangtangense]